MPSNLKIKLRALNKEIAQHNAEFENIVANHSKNEEQSKKNSLQLSKDLNAIYNSIINKGDKREPAIGAMLQMDSKWI